MIETDSLQHDLLHDLPPALSGRVRLLVLDLFSGIGGLSIGFRDAGCSVTGVDSEPVSGQVYERCEIGEFIKADLRQVSVPSKADIVVGGPPCRPWAAINQKRRRREHDDHALLGRFFDHILGLMPGAFLMENVPALRSDDTYRRQIQLVQNAGYSTYAQLVRYSDYGAATSRTRLFTVGLRASTTGALEFFRRLQHRRRPPLRVREAIERLREEPRNGVPDHDWSELQSIGNYTERYASGRFGWKKLDYDQPAPSFGSIAKTYILHPESGCNGFPTRVLSVREAMAIIGFGSGVEFPAGVARAKRYQMVANAVSPVVSRAAAVVLIEMLTGAPQAPLTENSAGM